MADTTAPLIIHSLWAMTASAFIFMCLRLLCKQRYGKPFGPDDIILVVAWICLLLYTCLTIRSTTFGIGEHMADITPENFKDAVKTLYAGEMFAILAVSISKTSFAVTLLRLANQPRLRYALWYIIVSVNLVMGLCCLFTYIQCSPVSKVWDISVPGSCWDPMIAIKYAIFAGSYSGAMDFILAVFPWILIWNVRMDTREKLGVVVAMNLGVLAGVAAAVKTSYLNGIARSQDFTYTSANLLIWAGCETAVTIMGVSIPYYRLAFVEVAKRSKRQQDSYMLSDANTAQSRRTRRNTTRPAQTVSSVVAGPSRQDWDSGSKEHILEGVKNSEGPGIRQTTTITVAFRELDSESQKSAVGTLRDESSC